MKKPFFFKSAGFSPDGPSVPTASTGPTGDTQEGGGRAKKGLLGGQDLMGQAGKGYCEFYSTCGPC